MVTAEAQQAWTLATDLDGTLIPLAGDVQNVRDLDVLARERAARRIPLVFVSGRHLASVQHAIATYGLPVPDYIIGDVGTSIYTRDRAVGEEGADTQGSEFHPIQAYVEHLQEKVNDWPMEGLRERLADWPELELQEPEKQGRFKLSFYAPPNQMHDQVEQLRQFLDSSSAPYSIVSSVDPFDGGGLIDVLPRGVSKAYALDWWTDFTGRDRSHVVYAGDSGNDGAVFASGYRCIVVGNAAASVVHEAAAAHRAAGWTDRLYHARQAATSGVLEGCRFYKLL